MKILQINTNRKQEALDMALATANRLNISFILISEPNKTQMGKRSQWISDDRLDSGIIILDKTAKVQAQGKGVGYTYIKVNNIYIFSCYFSGNQEMDIFESQLADISIQLRNSGGKAVIGGDFNSKSPQWTLNKKDRRGTKLEEWIAENDLILLNENYKSTFICENYSSVLDLTMVTSDLAVSAANWDVLEEESLSDHKYVVFEILAPISCNKESVKPQGWQVKKINVEKFKRATDRLRWEGEITSGDFSNKLRELCNISMPIRKKSRTRKPVYWWTTEVANLRKECLCMRRLYTRAMKRNNLFITTEAWYNYQNSRKKLRDKIKGAKKLAWNKLVNDIDRDIWGDGYKIAIKSTIGYSPPTSLTLENMEVITKELFPGPPVEISAMEDQDSVIDLNYSVINSCDITISDNETVIFLDFTIKELEEATEKLKIKKAPGPGSIPPEIVKMLATKCPEYVLKVYNKFSKEGVFPAQWKIAKLLLLPKGKKTPGDPISYRPICLLDVEGKLFELLIAARLHKEIERTGGLSDNQYGFRCGRQTTDAVKKVIAIATEAAAYSWKYRRLCAVLTLDVKNAFNCASWDQILEVLCSRGVNKSLFRIVKSYLSERNIILEAGDKRKTLEIQRGVPQGSILGPVLWNILYDDLFKIALPAGVTLIGFADDVAVTVVAKTEEALMGSANLAMREVAKWMQSRQLELAPQKTEAIILTKKRKIGPIRFEINGTVIKPARSIKYLGVWLDTKLTFNEHVSQTLIKAGKTITALSRIMPNTNGPRSSKRRVLSSVVHSKLLYAAPVWYTVLENKYQKSRLISIQRAMAIRVCSAYRTISTAAVFVLACIPPIDIMALERKEKYEGVNKTDSRRNVLARWQSRWEQEETGRWTYELIPDIEKWINRPCDEVDYFLTQALSGHGCFRKYLYEKNRADSSECRYCNQVDDVRHTLFECVRWNEIRESFYVKSGTRFNINTLKETLTAKENTWRIMYETIRKIIEIKEREDKEINR